MAFRTFQAYLDDQSLITIELENQFYAEPLQFTIETVDSTQTLQIRTLKNKMTSCNTVLLLLNR